ncbi:MAG: hypothetical protein IJT47_02070 [Selenomonadaceae bacterium]|nr:hypothetical protein [Selenomonadaceae bacterium]
MNAELKTVRKEMTAGDLKGIMDLPNYADNQRVEVTVYPTAREEQKKILSEEEIAAIWRRIEGYLVGIDKSKTLDDWRKERLEERYGIKLAD